MAPLSFSHYYNILRRAIGERKKLRPTRIRDKKMNLKALAVTLLLAVSPSLMAQSLLSGAKTSAEDKGESYNAKGDWAVFVQVPMAVNFSNYSMRYGGSIGKYVSNHSSLMGGFMYNLGRSKFETVSTYGYPTTKTMETNSIIIPITYSYSIFNPSGFNIQLQGGIAYNYVTSMKLGSDRYDLSNVDRGAFSGHVRLVLSYLGGIFVEYDFPFEDGDGIVMYGFDFNW